MSKFYIRKNRLENFREVDKETFLLKLYVGDILNCQSEGFGAWLVRFGTDSEVNHSALYVGGGENYIIEARANGGVLKNDLKKVLKRYNEIRVLRYNKLTLEQADEIKEYAYSRLNKKYDKRQIIGFSIRNFLRKLKIILPWRKNLLDSKNKDVCSELVYNAYQKAGIELVKDKHESNITPGDLDRAEALDTIMIYTR